jgi:ArsR family transcriptional regulator
VNDSVFADLLKALAQETRLKIFKLLTQTSEKGLPAGVIAASVDALPTLTSFHLKELMRVGLVTKQISGRHAIYRTDMRTMARIEAYVSSHFAYSISAGPTIAPAPETADPK